MRRSYPLDARNKMSVIQSSPLFICALGEGKGGACHDVRRAVLPLVTVIIATPAA